MFMSLDSSLSARVVGGELREESLMIFSNGSMSSGHVSEVLLCVKDVRSRSGVIPEWKGFDNKIGTTLASARVLCLDLLLHVWLHISGGLNCCQEFRRGMV